MELSQHIMEDFSRLEREMPIRAQIAAQDLADAIQAVAPVKSGTLRASVTVVPDPSGASVVAEAPYASYVDEGTRRMAATLFFSGTIERMEPQTRKTIFED